MTGLETRSATAPSRSAPASRSTTAVTSASAADSAANRAVAVVALTTSVRDVPSSA
jgi:hypothetical protein